MAIGEENFHEDKCRWWGIWIWYHVWNFIIFHFKHKSRSSMISNFHNIQREIVIQVILGYKEMKKGEVPSNLSIGSPWPPFIHCFVSHWSCPSFTSSVWNTHIMIPTAKKFKLFSNLHHSPETVQGKICIWNHGQWPSPWIQRYIKNKLTFNPLIFKS